MTLAATFFSALLAFHQGAANLQRTAPSPSRGKGPLIHATEPAKDLPAARPASIVHSAVSTANGLTKWLVVAAQTTAVVTRRDFAAPYIVVGSIGASYTAHALKKAINQRRPEGSPLIDPGMPSSHALVATFAAAAWAMQVGRRPATLALGAAAAIVSILRVATGYHTWAQIGVGAATGAAGARAWMTLGAGLTPCGAATRPAVRTIYAFYLLGSAAFITQKMEKWDWRN